MFEVFLFNLRFHGGVAFQPRKGNEVHIIKGELGELFDMRLHENRRFFRIEPARKIIERDFRDIRAHLFGIIKIIGERLRVGDHHVDLVEFTAILQFHAPFERAHVVPDMQFSRGAVARKNNIFHNFSIFTHTLHMKRIFLAGVALCFVCAIAALILETREMQTYRNRPSAPVWGEKRIYRLAP